MKIRALIAEDEPLAREWLRDLLAAEPDIDVIAECGNGADAVESSIALKPDLLFLDVQMPELDGFGVLEALGDERPRCVVFVTAFDHYALKAFEVHALDYLRKPFDRERLQKTLERVRSEVDAPADGLGARLAALLETLEQPRRPERIAVKDNGKVYFLRVEEIDWVEAYGNYVKLHVGPQTHLLLQTMAGMESRLDPERFLRIHRSTIVNIDRIASLEPLFHGEYAVTLLDKTVVTLSRGYRERLQELIERFS